MDRKKSWGNNRQFYPPGIPNQSTEVAPFDPVNRDSQSCTNQARFTLAEENSDFWILPKVPTSVTRQAVILEEERCAQVVDELWDRVKERKRTADAAVFFPLPPIKGRKRSRLVDNAQLVYSPADDVIAKNAQFARNRVMAAQKHSFAASLYIMFTTDCSSLLFSTGLDGPFSKASSQRPANPLKQYPSGVVSSQLVSTEEASQCMWPPPLLLDENSNNGDTNSNKINTNQTVPDLLSAFKQFDQGSLIVAPKYQHLFTGFTSANLQSTQSDGMTAMKRNRNSQQSGILMEKLANILYSEKDDRQHGSGFQFSEKG